MCCGHIIPKEADVHCFANGLLAERVGFKSGCDGGPGETWLKCTSSNPLQHSLDAPKHLLSVLNHLLQSSVLVE